MSQNENENENEMNQGREMMSLVLNRVVKWTIFVLNREAK